MKKIHIVGLGGIGSQLCEPICRYINFLDNAKDYVVNLIDGDTYEPSNQSRQNISLMNVGENKAVSQCNKLRTLFPNLEINSESIYINSRNMKDLFSSKDIILLGVDNHKTRRLTQDYCESLDDVFLVSGGNEWIYGEALLYIKKNGKELTPKIWKYNPGIEEYTDRSPEDIGCEELVESAPQLIFTNGMAAMCMQMAFYNYYEIFEKELKVRASEIVFNIPDMRVVPKLRDK